MSCGCGGSTHSGCGDFTIRPRTTRIDITVNAGESLELLIPILDAACEPVEIVEGTEGDWTAEAMVRRNALGSVALHTWTTAGDDPNAFIVPGSPAQVRLVATAAETSQWQVHWPDFTNSWDLMLTEPATSGGEPYRLGAGLFNLSAQHTR
jgi:hypothetical protein